MPARHPWSSSLLLLLATACSGSPGTPDAVPALDCGDRLGLEVRIPGRTYASIDAAADATELVQGFQGFRYLYARGRLDVDPGEVSAVAVLQLDGGSARSQPIGDLAFGPDAGGVVSDPVQLFFNDDPLPDLIDQGVTLELRLGDRCTDGGHTILRYDPTCVEGPDGTPICNTAMRAGAP